MQKLESTDGFVIWDLEGADHSVGVARLAPKILKDGAEMLARSVTYSFAAYGIKASGASAAINAKPDGRDAAIAAFVEELAPLAAERRLVLHPGNGLSDGDIAPLTSADDTALHDNDLLARSAVAAAEAINGGSLEGATVAIVGAGPVADATAVAVGDRGATVNEDGGLAADVDVLFVAGKSGLIGDDDAHDVAARAVVPLTRMPVSARAYAVLKAAGSTYVPDFVALAAPLLVTFAGDDPVD